MGASQKKYYLVDKLEKDVRALQDMNSDLRRCLDAEKVNHATLYTNFLISQAKLKKFRDLRIHHVSPILTALQCGQLSVSSTLVLLEKWLMGEGVKAGDMPVSQAVPLVVKETFSVMEITVAAIEQRDRLSQTLEEIISLRDEANQALNVLRQAREAKVPFYGEVEGAFIACRDKLYEAYDKARTVVEDVKNGH